MKVELSQEEVDLILFALGAALALYDDESRRKAIMELFNKLRFRSQSSPGEYPAPE